MAQYQTKYPWTNFLFQVEIDGMNIGGFTEVAGLTIETEVKTIREGGNNTEYKLFNGVKFSDITLKRGFFHEILFDWYQQSIQGKIVRKNGSIYLLNNIGKYVKGWHFFEACPIRWEGPQLNSLSSSFATETIVLAHHKLIKAEVSTEE